MAKRTFARLSLENRPIIDIAIKWLTANQQQLMEVLWHTIQMDKNQPMTEMELDENISNLLTGINEIRSFSIFDRAKMLMSLLYVYDYFQIATQKEKDKKHVENKRRKNRNKTK